MSSLFGPVVQHGYVVPDVDVAVAHWLARGVGPFFIADIAGMLGLYDGEKISADMRAAFAYCGDQQIEVITPEGTNPSIYKDYLESNPSGGVQHVAYWVDDIDEKLNEITLAGHDFKVWQRYGEEPDFKAHAYIDSTTAPGVMIQLMARSAFYEMYFGIMKQAAYSWDGQTNPIRMLDMSDGRPKEVPYVKPA